MFYNIYRGEEYWLLVFPGTFQALTAEESLTKAGLAPQLFALPQELGLGCGTGITVTKANGPQSLELLQKKDLPLESLWEGQGDKIWHKIRRRK